MINALIGRFFGSSYRDPTHPSGFQPTSQPGLAANLAVGAGRELAHLFTKAIPNRWGYSGRTYHRLEEPMIWKEHSKGLYVFIHGLFGHPSIFDDHIAGLESEADFDLFYPYVPKEGDCTLEEAAAPILKKLLEYVEKFPHNPICFIGVSNGGRIDLHLECQLREKSPQTPVKISNVAGAHLGSSAVSLIRSLPLICHLYSPVVREELSYNSPTNLQLIQRVQQTFGGQRDYEFYSAQFDTHVPNRDSTLLPCLPARRYTLHSCGHSSLVGLVKTHQLASCQAWMQEHGCKNKPVSVK